MKHLTLIVAGVLTVIILIILFQNVTNSGDFQLFLGGGRMSMAVPILLTAIIAGVMGALYAVGIRTLLIDEARASDDEVEREQSQF